MRPGLRSRHDGRGVGDDRAGCHHGGRDAAPFPSGKSRGTRVERAARGRRRVRRSLSHHQAARHGRHGRRLSGVGCRAGGRARAEGHQAGRRCGSRSRRRDRTPFQARAAPRATGHPSQRRADSRPRGIRRHQVHHDAVHQGHRPGGHPERKGDAARSGRAPDRVADCGGPPGRSRGRRRPPRSQTRQHHDRRRSTRADHRLRHRPGRVGSGDPGRSRRSSPEPAWRARRDRWGHTRGNHRRFDRVHGAGAGARRAGRPSSRHLRVRAGPLPDARGPAARARGRRHPRGPPGAADEGAAAAARDRRHHPGGGGRDRVAVRAAGSRGPVPDHRGARRRAQPARRAGRPSARCRCSC